MIYTFSARNTDRVTFRTSSAKRQIYNCFESQRWWHKCLVSDCHIYWISYNFNNFFMLKIDRTAGDNSGGVRVPKKLRCVTQNNTIHNKRIQSNHLDTESSASDSNEDECVLSDLHLNNSSPSNSNLNRPSTNAVVSESRSSPPSNSQIKVWTADCREICIQIKDDNNQNSNQEGIQKLSTIKGMMIHVKRSHDLELQRRLLPIYAEEQEIVEAINDNIVCFIKIFQFSVYLFLSHQKH